MILIMSKNKIRMPNLWVRCDVFRREKADARRLELMIVKDDQNASEVMFLPNTSRIIIVIYRSLVRLLPHPDVNLW